MVLDQTSATQTWVLMGGRWRRVRACAPPPPMQMRFAWWPFHPVGYALLSSYATHILWLLMLLSSLITTAIVRYGGRRLYSVASSSSV